MPEFIREIDMFGQTVPTFNIGGKEQVKTSIGAIASILIFFLTFAFGLIKLEHLAERKNPTINLREDELDELFGKFSTSYDDFMMAFAA